MKTNTDLAHAVYRNKILEQEKKLREVAAECQAVISNTSASVPLEDCPTIWDGIMCWPSTPSGLLRSLPCPGYIVGFNPQRFSSKQCTADGEWFVSWSTNKTWTNYTQCYSDRTTNVVVKYPDIENASLVAQYVPIVKAVSHVGYGVSLATLVVAFCIFATFKRLRCPRNKLHMHLFVSFMLRAFLTLLKDSLFVKGIGLPSDLTVKDGVSHFVHGNQYSWQCKLLVSLWQYFLMANYSWILMEGLYLHNLIFFSVFSDTSSIVLYVVLGWGLPMLFVMPWVFVRAFLEDTFCWTTNENVYHFQLIKGPTTLSILAVGQVYTGVDAVVRGTLRRVPHHLLPGHRGQGGAGVALHRPTVRLLPGILRGDPLLPAERRGSHRVGEEVEAVLLGFEGCRPPRLPPSQHPPAARQTLLPGCCVLQPPSPPLPVPRERLQKRKYGLYGDMHEYPGVQQRYHRSQYHHHVRLSAGNASDPRPA